MGEHGLIESVTQVRDRLTALCTRLETERLAPGSPEIVGSLHDVREIFDALQARYGLLREILDRTSDAVFAKDLDGRYAMINPLGAEMFGKTVDEVLGADDRSVFDHADAARVMASDREVIASGEPCSREDTCSFRGVRTTLLTTTTAWYDRARVVRGVIGIAQDVTERRRSERAAAEHRLRMRSMTSELVLDEETLRRSLAAELHNGLGQELALAKMKLATLRQSASAELRDALSSIVEIVERADRSLRSITFQISPPSLHDLGLVAALQWLAEDVGARYAIGVSIDDAGSPRVTDDRIRVILFRAVRELLVNAAEHSGSKTAVVRLSSVGDRILIEVEDLGEGFDATDADRRGFGLLGVREQLEYIDAELVIDSVAGRGTLATITAPTAGRVPIPLA